MHNPEDRTFIGHSARARLHRFRRSVGTVLLLRHAKHCLSFNMVNRLLHRRMSSISPALVGSPSHREFRGPLEFNRLLRRSFGLYMVLFISRRSSAV